MLKRVKRKGLAVAHARFVTLMIKARARALSRRCLRSYSSEIRLPPAGEDNANDSVELSKHPRAHAEAYAEQSKQTPEHGLTTLPYPPDSVHPRPSPPYSSMHPPFHTHNFVSALERSFPSPIARTLMRSTRAMLIDKIGHCRRQGLGKKDMENQAYLFKAALTELRNDTAMRIRNETAGINTSLAASRRELDSLSGRMKEQLDTLRHENQMEVDNRKNEARTDLKKQALLIENVTSKAMIQLGDLRTEMERTRWTNMYRSILSLGAVGAMIVLFMEITKGSGPAEKPKSPASTIPPPVVQNNHEVINRPVNETGESSYVT